MSRFYWPCTVLLAIVAASLPGAARAQTPPNLPPPGAYSPIPNFVGTNAGLQFRGAINDRFSGAQPISPKVVNLAFANLPAEQDGQLIYCSDCQKTNPCTSGGSGAWAFGQNGGWTCSNSSWAAAGVNTLTAPLVNSSGTLGTNTVPTGTVNVVTDHYGVLSTSQTTRTGTLTSASHSIPLSSIGDFAIGQGVFIPHAGPTASVSAPTGFSCALDAYTLNSAPTATLGHNQCNVDSSNAACATNRTMVLMAVDYLGGLSPASSAQTVASGPTTLTSNNAIKCSANTVANAVAYVELGCTGSSCTPTSVWQVIPPIYNGGTIFFYDYGIHGGTDPTYGTSISTGVQSSGANQDLSTTITGVSGNTITVTAAPSTSGTFTVFHDNAPIVNAGVTAANAAGGGDVILPMASGGAPYNVSQLSLFNIANVYLHGNLRGFWGSTGNEATGLNYIGSLGRPMFYENWAPGDKVSDFQISGYSPGEVFYLDSDTFNTGNQRSKGNEVFHIAGGSASQYVGAFVTVGANSSGGENEFAYLHDNYGVGNASYLNYLVAAGFQTDNTRIESNTFQPGNFGEWENSAGTIRSVNNDCGPTRICHDGRGFIKHWLIEDYAETGEYYYEGENVSGAIDISNTNIGSGCGPNGYTMVGTFFNLYGVNYTPFAGGTGNCLIGITHNGNGSALIAGSSFGNSTYTGDPHSLPVSLEPPGNLPITDGQGVNFAPQFTLATGSSIFVWPPPYNHALSLSSGIATAGVNSAQVPATEHENLTLSANCTTYNLPVAADSEELENAIVQPSGGHNYTFPASLTAPGGWAIAFTSGCASLPTMPTGTGHALLFKLRYNANTPTPEIDVTSCETTGS